MASKKVLDTIAKRSKGGEPVQVFSITDGVGAELTVSKFGFAEAGAIDLDNEVTAEEFAKFQAEALAALDAEAVREIEVKGDPTTIDPDPDSELFVKGRDGE